MRRRLFGKHQGVEQHTVPALHRQHAAALLAQVVELNPGLQRLRLQGLRQRRRPGHRLAVDDQRAVLDARGAGQRQVQPPARLACVAVKGPLGQRLGQVRRRRQRTPGLQPGANGIELRADAAVEFGKPALGVRQFAGGLLGLPAQAGQVGEALLHLPGAGLAGKGLAEHPAHALVLGPTGEHPLRPVSRPAQDVRIVEQGQRLRRHVGGVAAAAAAERHRRIEGGQERIQRVAHHLDVDAAPGLAAADRLAVQARIQAARHAQDGVADRFGLKPAHAPVAEQLVVRIRRAAAGLALEGLAGEQQAQQGLDRTAAVDEAPRQQVEQFRMRRRRTELAEIVGGGDQAAAEDVVPEAVDDDPRGQRVGLQIGDPLRQLQAAAAGGPERRRVEGVEKAARHRIGGLLVVAADEQRGVPGVGLDDARHAHRRRQAGFKVAVAPHQRGHLGQVGQAVGQPAGVKQPLQGLGLGVGQTVRLPGRHQNFRRVARHRRRGRRRRLAGDHRVGQAEPGALVLVLGRQVGHGGELQEDLVALPEAEIERAPAELAILGLLQLDGLVDRAGARVVLHDVLRLHAAAAGNAEPERAAFVAEALRVQHRAAAGAERVGKVARRPDAAEDAIAVERHSELPGPAALQALGEPGEAVQPRPVRRRLRRSGRHRRPVVQPGPPQGLLDFSLEAAQLGPAGLAGARRVGVEHRRMRAGEDAVERVEVGLRNGVELVVVAARAGDGQRLEGLGHRVDLVVGEGHLLVERVDRRKTVQDHAQLADADGAFVEAAAQARLRQQVAGDRLADQLRPGHVVVEGADQVVAVAPGVGDRRVALGTVGFGVAHPVHEVARPLLAELRAGQQGVDLGFVRSGCVRRRRQAGEDKAGAPAQGLGIRARSRRQPVAGKPGVDLVIDAAVRRHGPQRRERPPLLAPLQHGAPVGVARQFLRAGRPVARIRGAGSDPGFEVGQHRRLELRPVLRHLQVGVLVAHRLQQQRGRRLARHNRRTAVAAGLPARPRVEPQAPLLLAGLAVAFVALLRQHRPDARLKELDLLGRRCRGQAGAAGEHQPKARLHASSLSVMACAACTQRRPMASNWSRRSRNDGAMTVIAATGYWYSSRIAAPTQWMPSSPSARSSA